MSDTPFPPEDFDAAFDAAAARLRAAVADACARPGPWPGRVGTAIEAALAFAVEDTAATRLLLVEPWRRGVEAAARRRALLDHFASLLASSRQQAQGAVDRRAVTEEFLVGALAERVAKTLSDGPSGTSELAALGPELIEFVLLHYLDPASARLWSHRATLPRKRSGGSALAGPLRKITFAQVLSLLQGVIGSEAQVVVNLPGYFFDCGFHARLERVETLHGDDGPVLLVFAGAQGIALDPTELDCFLARRPGGTGYAWLELRLGNRLHLVIEPLSQSEPD